MTDQPSEKQKIEELLETGCQLGQLYDLADSHPWMKFMRVVPYDPTGFNLTVYIKGRRYTVSASESTYRMQTGACKFVLEKMNEMYQSEVETETKENDSK